MSREVDVEQLQGTVKWYSLAKGYGFITPDDGGDDVFIHHSSIPDEKVRPLQQGERVGYELANGPRGARAEKILRL